MPSLSPSLAALSPYRPPPRPRFAWTVSGERRGRRQTGRVFLACLCSHAIALAFARGPLPIPAPSSSEEAESLETTEPSPSDTELLIQSILEEEVVEEETRLRTRRQAINSPQIILNHITHSSSSYPFATEAGEWGPELTAEPTHAREDYAICHFEDRPPDHDLTWMESADNLVPIITNRKRYNMFLAPGQLKGQTTTVSVAIYIESMSSFKAQTMDFEVDMYLAMSWFDHRLVHNCSHPVLIAQKGLADRIWHPDLYFVNSKFAYLQEVTTPNFMVLVYPDGFIFKSMRVDVTLSCMMDLARYPMDVQECPIIIQSYAYIENVLNLTWHVDTDLGFPIGTNPNIVLNDMEIMDEDWHWCGGPYPMFRGTGNWSCLKASLTMKRLVVFHIIQTYVPTGMLVMISWLSFWLDPRAGPARISLTITTLLTLTTMSNSARQDLPQVSYIKALDIWLSVCTAFVFCVLLEYTLVSCFVAMKTSHCEHIRLVRKLTSSCDPARTSPASLRPARQHASARHEVKEDEFGLHMPLLTGHKESSTNATNATGPTPNTSIGGGLGLGGGGGGGGGPSAPARKPELNIKSCGFCAHKWEKTAKRIDKFSRAGFPLLFTLFTIAYWLAYSELV